MGKSMKVIALFLSLLALARAWQTSQSGGLLRRAVSAALVGASLAGPAVVHADPLPVTGQEAPDFNLPSNRGKELGLKDLKGWTVFYTYPGDFTQGCTIEAQAFERDYPKYQKLGAEILGLSVDSVDKHLDFGKKYGLEFPLVSDVGGVVANKYGSLLDFGFVGKFANRQTYIISPDHKIAGVFLKVEDRLASHSSEVLSKLEELTGKKL